MSSGVCLGHSTTRMTMDVYSHVGPALESDAAVKVDEALRGVFGQHLVSIGQNAPLTEIDEKAAEVRGIKVSGGGRERSRTSDPYSVKE
jgi:hypothetical protein